MRRECQKKWLILCICIAVVFNGVFVAPSFFDGTVYAADKKTVQMSSNIQYVTVGKSTTLTLKNANPSKVKWTSSKPKTASVNSSGRVTGLKKGTAVIRAKYNGKTYKCTVRVEKPSLNRTDIWIMVGTSTKLSLNGTAREVSWSSSNPSVASVKNGTVTANKIGTAKIYAKVGGRKYKCKVKVVTKQEAYAEQLVEMINYERSTYGIPPLRSNKYLKRAAQIRAEELSKKFSDTRPNNTSCFSAIPQSYKWRKASELAARKYVEPKQVVRAWAADSDQLAILLKKNYRDIGVGVYVAQDGYLYWCVFEAVR